MCHKSIAPQLPDHRDRVASQRRDAAPRQFPDTRRSLLRGRDLAAPRAARRGERRFGRFPPRRICLLHAVRGDGGGLLPGGGADPRGVVPCARDYLTALTVSFVQQSEHRGELTGQLSAAIGGYAGSRRRARCAGRPESLEEIPWLGHIPTQSGRSPPR